jgi:hypothetical protein
MEKHPLMCWQKGAKVNMFKEFIHNCAEQPHACKKV